jgi:hypothetical protein
MKKTKIMWVALAGAGLGALACAQDNPNQVKIPFRDASKPRMVNADVFNGSIIVKGYAGNEVIVESAGRPGRRERVSNVPDGMHRIGDSGSGLDITEDNNVVTIRAGVMGGGADVTIQVPTQTSLKLRSMNGGRIQVDGVSG